jgi:fucose permease
MQTNTTETPKAKTNLLILAYIAFVALGLPIGLLGVAWPTMRADFHLSLDTMGILLFSSSIGYILASFFIGRLINRFGIASLLVSSNLLTVVALVGYALSPYWGLIVGLGVLVGFGGGAMDAGLNTYLAAEYNESQMQWLHACFGLGATLSPLIMTASLSLFSSWRPGYIFVGVVTALLTVAFWVTYSAWKAPKKVSETDSGEGPGLMDYQTSIWESLRHPLTWLGIILFLLYTGAEFTLGSWTYTIFTEGRGISPEIAGIWAGGFWGTFTIGRALGGLYAHRFRLNTLLVSSISLSLFGSILFWWNPLPIVGVLGVFVTGFGMAPVFAGLISSTSQRVGEHHAANTIGIQMAAANLGGTILPAAGGFLAQRLSLEVIPAMLVMTLIVMFILYMFSTRMKATE